MDRITTIQLHHVITHPLSILYTEKYQDRAMVSFHGFKIFFVDDLRFLQNIGPSLKNFILECDKSPQNTWKRRIDHRYIPIIYQPSEELNLMTSHNEFSQAKEHQSSPSYLNTLTLLNCSSMVMETGQLSWQHLGGSNNNSDFVEEEDFILCQHIRFFDFSCFVIISQILDLSIYLSIYLSVY